MLNFSTVNHQKINIHETYFAIDLTTKLLNYKNI